MEIRPPIEYLGDYIGGQFIKPGRPDGEWTKTSPANLKETVIELSYEFDHVEKACVAAREAYKDWCQIPASKRFEYLQRLKEVYLSHKEELAEVIARETGKPMWEALTEAQGMAGKIDITINHSMKLDLGFTLAIWKA